MSSFVFFAFGGFFGSCSVSLSLGVLEHVLVIQFGTSVLDRLQNGLAGRFEELTLFELELTLDLLALDIWDEERRDQILDKHLGFVALFFDSI